MRSHRTKAFTITELVVVVGLLLTLALFALTVGKKMAGEKTKMRCLHNVRSLGMLLQIAIKEHGPVMKAWYTGSTGMMWNTMLITEGYLTHDALKRLSCPDIEYASPNGSISGRHYGIYMNDPFGKILKTTDDQGRTGNNYTLNLLTHPSPSKSIFLADSVTQAGAPSIRILPPTASFTGGGIHIRHQGRANLFFLDGHVETADVARLGRLGVGAVYSEEVTRIDLPLP